MTGPRGTVNFLKHYLKETTTTVTTTLNLFSQFSKGLCSPQLALTAILDRPPKLTQGQGNSHQVICYILSETKQKQIL